MKAKKSRVLSSQNNNSNKLALKTDNLNLLKLQTFNKGLESYNWKSTGGSVNDNWHKNLSNDISFVEHFYSHSIISYNLDWSKRQWHKDIDSPHICIFLKDSSGLYRLTLCFLANVKRCTVVTTKPISQHENLTIKGQRLLTGHYLN